MEPHNEQASEGNSSDTLNRIKMRITDEIEFFAKELGHGLARTIQNTKNGLRDPKDVIKEYLAKYDKDKGSVVDKEWLDEEVAALEQIDKLPTDLRIDAMSSGRSYGSYSEAFKQVQAKREVYKLPAELKAVADRHGNSEAGLKEAQTMGKIQKLPPELKAVADGYMDPANDYPMSPTEAMEEVESILKIRALPPKLLQIAHEQLGREEQPSKVYRHIIDNEEIRRVKALN